MRPMETCNMPNNVEQKVQELETRYRLIADNLIDAIWVLDVEREQYDFVTPSIIALSGETPEEAKQSTIKDRMPPDSYEKVSQVIADGLANFKQGADHKRNLEVEMYHKDGHTYWLEITAKFFRDQEGKLKIAGVSKNITKRKQAEFQRERLIKQLSKALAEKEELLEEIKLLRGLLPICSACKRIRDSQGRWWPLDAYVEKRGQAQLTHRICPDCSEVLYQVTLKSD
jgi:PAS domain S-box-containing protein